MSFILPDVDASIINYLWEVVKISDILGAENHVIKDMPKIKINSLFG